MVLAEKTDGFVSTTGDVVTVAVEADAAAGLRDPKENIPLPTMVVLLSSLLAGADVAVADPKPNEELAGAVSVELAVIAPAANDPKVTADFCSVSDLVLLIVDVVLGVTAVGGCPNEKPVLFAVSASLLAGEPKLSPLVAVVEVTVSELFLESDLADFDPKLNPPEPRVVAGVVGSFFSLVLELSVMSEEAAGLLPKLNPVAGAPVVAAGTVLPVDPKLNLGLSSELVVLVVDVTEPKLKPVLVDVVALVELAGTPKENPVVLRASFPSES